MAKLSKLLAAHTADAFMRRTREDVLSKMRKLLLLAGRSGAKAFSGFAPPSEAQLARIGELQAARLLHLVLCEQPADLESRVDEIAAAAVREVMNG